MTPAPDPAEPLLGLDDIQAHVVPGFGQARQRLLGLSVDEDDPATADAVRALLTTLVARITPARRGLAHRETRRAAKHSGATPELPEDDPATALAVSARCLRVLGNTTVATLDQAFSVGMAGRSTLRDPRPDTWDVGGPGGEIDLLIVLASDDRSRLDEAADQVVSAIDGSPLRLVHDQCGHRLPDDIEHFGFRDGISQPVLRGLVSDDPVSPLVERLPMPAMPDGRAYAGPGDVLVWPGQFLLGLPRQRSTSATAPGTVRPSLPELARNGSFLVYRKLAQDVPGFRDDTARIAGDLAGVDGPVDPAELQALLVGRWPGGWPLVRGAPDPTAPSRALNHFSYDNDVPAVSGDGQDVGPVAADADGRRCPLAAHIRKVNPRDQETDRGTAAETLTFAILRRGIPYGPLWRDDLPADDPVNAEERGLLFLCYQADIGRQFELLITDWANQVDNPRQGQENGLDLVIGRAGGPAQAPVAREAPLATDRVTGTVSTLLDYVVPRGGGYLFTPSIPAVRALANGPE